MNEAFWLWAGVFTGSVVTGLGILAGCAIMAGHEEDHVICPSCEEES